LQKTGKKKAYFIDLFYTSVKDEPTEKLKLAARYIESLTSKEYNINKFSIGAFLLALFVNVFIEYASKADGDDFFITLFKVVSAGILIIITINIFINICFLKKSKLLKIKKYIDLVLLIRESEKEAENKLS